MDGLGRLRGSAGNLLFGFGVVVGDGLRFGLFLDLYFDVMIINGLLRCALEATTLVIARLSCRLLAGILACGNLVKITGLRRLHFTGSSQICTSPATSLLVLRTGSLGPVSCLRGRFD